MTRSTWDKCLSDFKESERPETVLVMAGQSELVRIALAWMQTEVTRAKRLTLRQGRSEGDLWSWLWENARYDRAALLGRIPNASPKTERNFDALIANQALYPDGTLNSYVGRYLKERIVRLFAHPSRGRKRSAG